jgi:uncharacterized protein YecE (DUF72 family)
MGDLLYGTASFSDKSWVGPFYPEGTQPKDFLKHYATQFRVVEADTTYYGVPRESMGFEICAKFPRGIVHAGEGRKPDTSVVLVPDKVGQETDDFLGAMRLLGNKCGPLVLQFPFFHSDTIAFGDFMERLDIYLDRLPKDLRYAVEIRNKTWIREPLLHILRRHRVAYVASELPYMPHPADLAQRLDLHTADFFYGRLIGDRKEIDRRTKTFDRLVVDQTPSLRRWAELLRDMKELVSRVYVFANNHFAGHAPATIRELVELVG